MSTATNRLGRTLLLMGLAVLTAQSVKSQEPELLLYRLDESSLRQTLLDDDLTAPKVALGEAVVVCFSVPQSGWVNLWSIGADGSFDRIFPNALSGHESNGLEVTAGQDYCVGNDEMFRLRVRGDEGRAQVYLGWARNEHELLAPEHYIDLFSQVQVQEQRTRTIRTYTSGRTDVYFPYTVVE